MKRTILFLALFCTSIIFPALFAVQNPALQDPDHFKWTPPDPFPNRQQWDQRAEQLRQKVLLSAGLLPARERTALNARIFDLKEGQGFKVAKVYFESFPGFLATGNIYYPTIGKPPYPAILSPHGHWQYGRLQNGDTGSIPGRSIDFARQGYVVFAIDMVGFNDSFQLPHDGAKSRAQLVADMPLPYEPRLFRADWFFPEAELYGFNLGGMQLWNGIRAIDFLTSLPEVDGNRIAVTGASGGATQTILLMAADPRVKVAAPVNIIGAEKQPGCGCENLPGLWIRTSTIELAATFAPRPLILISATRDPWTNSTPTRELPIFKRYYSLFGAQDKVENFHVDAEHNYNSQSRAAVYAFFRKHLNPPGPAIADPAPVAPGLKSLGDLRVFPDGILPKAAKAGRDIAGDWMKSSKDRLEKAFPTDPSGLARFQEQYAPPFREVLNVEQVNKAGLKAELLESGPQGKWSAKKEKISWKSDSFILESLRPGNQPAGILLLTAPAILGPLVSGSEGKPVFPWLGDALNNGNAVYRVRGYADGTVRIPEKLWESMSWPGSYNRSNELLGIQEIMAALAAIRAEFPSVPVTVVGIERTGLLAAFAAAAQGGAGRVVIDLNGEDPGFDKTMVRLLPVGAVRCVGDLKTAVLLAGAPVHFFNPGESFDPSWYREQASRSSVRISIHGAVSPLDPDFIRTLEK
jgi:dienelactone hydrolase